MFNPKVSIIIPVYNWSNYLSEAIESALAQTYKNIEILVINDWSNDNWASEKIALSFGDKINYIYKENGWVATALNLWIEKASWEYISWLSRDNLYYSNKI
jgi:glycosyltransferase involved in cell wall biosynthesis